MTKDFWNERFAIPDYVYGQAPNQFLATELKKLTPGKILFPAEGEGRNAVYAAQNGWQVTAYDFSEKAREKAIALASAAQVNVNYLIASHEEAHFADHTFDVIALIYAHTPFRAALHNKVMQWVKPGGILLVEGFSKEQLRYQSGGPKDPQLLFSVEELEHDFSGCKEINIRQELIFLSEGAFHRGEASVIRAVIKR